MSRDDIWQQLQAIVTADPHIRALGLEGSLSNPISVADERSDIDATVFVDVMARFSPEWFDQFGPVIIVQSFMDTSLFHESGTAWQVELMRLQNGVRLDLKIAPVADITEYLASDSLNQLVLNKDGELGRPSSERDFITNEPSETEFNETLNEFYWQAGNISKGLKRKQLIYANEMFNQHLRPEMLRVLAWQISRQSDWEINLGFEYKYLGAYIALSDLQMLNATYVQDSISHTHHSLYVALKLMGRLARTFAGQQNWQLPVFVARVEQELGVAASETDENKL
ncbi:hypothetical protein EQG49_09970 [Periweissella cryptocerci]|uniref:Aminoglycoside 6-adenylyltransferase n=1 Tax=Periweissella cryptocerci TaxID=2506420 RepID=A0A4P6YVE0_9LACO|nr:aminoglycoside 6-adenylyltransferase [Periweissella cryptocerci]QBO36762.1 hypothetical protein EQG49_09970 [Periweissella cryptocerci]